MKIKFLAVAMMGNTVYTKGDEADIPDITAGELIKKKLAINPDQFNGESATNDAEADAKAKAAADKKEKAAAEKQVKAKELALEKAKAKAGTELQAKEEADKKSDEEQRDSE